MKTPLTNASLLIGLMITAVPFAGCGSLRRVAVRSLARSLQTGGTVWAGDDDPQLVRDALPFALKTIESLLAADPQNRDLLLAAASGFTQYAYAFIEGETGQGDQDPAAALAARGRARRMYLRARDYAVRGLDLRRPGIRAALQQDPAKAVAAFGVDDVPFLYWSGAAWGAAIASGKDHPELIADLAAVRALLERARALREDFAHGAIHAALLPLDALSPAMGGSPEHARLDYERALALSGGHDAGLFVTWAMSIAMPAQDRAGFEAAIQRALDVDADAYPENRLANLVSQRRARYLKQHVDDLFL